ncbi:MAG: FHA domain-containing protein [Lentisphaerae bacterium]|nr:FHA domain-containing protein [Lentisphaerota bacterium]
MAFLIVYDGSEDGNRIELTETNEVFIGRSADRSDIVIPAGSISGRHCLLTRGSEHFTIKDLDSTNGTFVNDDRVDDEAEVYRNDIITLGNIQMVIGGNDVPARDTSDLVSDAPPALQPGTGSPMIRATSTQTIKVLPTSFQKKKTGNKAWIVLIVVAVIIALGLLWYLIRM